MSAKNAIKDALYKVEHPFDGPGKYDPKNARPEPPSDGHSTSGEPEHLEPGREETDTITVDPKTGKPVKK